MFNFKNLFKSDKEIAVQYLDKLYKEKGVILIMMIEKQNKIKDTTIDDLNILNSFGNVLKNIKGSINLGDYIMISDNRLIWKNFINKRIKKQIREYFGVKTDLHKRLKKD